MPLALRRPVVRESLKAHGPEALPVLLAARGVVKDGGTLLEAVCLGTLPAWFARQFLELAAGMGLQRFEEGRYVDKAARLTAVERAIRLARGNRHGGGWKVSR